MVEQVYTTDLKSVEQSSSGFKSRYPHQDKSVLLQEACVIKKLSFPNFLLFNLPFLFLHQVRIAQILSV